MKYHLLFAILLAVFSFGAIASADPPKPASDREVQDFVFLSEKGPVLIRFHVRIDGKPLLDVWDEFMGKLFAYLDVNGDGVLSKEEAARVPPVQALFNNVPRFPGQILRRRAANPGMTLDSNKDGKITRAELANYYRRNGAVPLQFRMGGEQQDRFFVAFAGIQNQPLSADALNKRFFELLDRNKDGKLSREELARAPAVFQKLDADDDEMVSIQEMNNNVATGTDDAVVFVAAEVAPQPVNNGSFIMVNPGEASKQLARQLLERYGPKGQKLGDRKLTAQNLGIDEATFAQLDADQDGFLDAEELARFAQRAPDLEFRIRLGRKTDKEVGIELVKRKKRPTPLTQSVRPGSKGTLLVELGSTQIELGQGSGANESGNVRVFNSVNEQYLAQFRMADKDNNGYLDKNEADQSPLFRNLFKVMDRDGDGKLFKKEVVAYLDKMKDLQEAASRSCASLTFKDQGRGLFDLIDANSDGRLSVRELRQMVKLVDQLDRDGDGQISPSEIPHKYRVDVQQGPANGNQSGLNRVVVFRSFGMNVPDLPKLTAGPQWFRKMDRNQDGDVSRREFLGTDKEFQRIDTDGDGLISVEEAERADKLFRKKKNSKP